MASDFSNLEAGKLGPYSAVAIFSLGVLLSNFVFISVLMRRPLRGEPVSPSAYFQADLRTHSIGVLGGTIWGMGMTFSLLATGPAGFAISYGLGQGATMVAALWGVFIWKEFRGAPPGTNHLISLMFICFVVGLLSIILSRTV